jgi:hypothetical protein
MTFNYLNDSKSSFFDLIKNGSEPLKSQVKNNESFGIKYINDSDSNVKQSEFEKELFDQQINTTLQDGLNEVENMAENDKNVNLHEKDQTVADQSIDDCNLKQNTDIIKPVENDYFSNYINEKYKSLKLRKTENNLKLLTTRTNPLQITINDFDKEKIDQMFATSVEKLNKNNCGIIISDIKSNVVLDFIKNNKMSQKHSETISANEGEQNETKHLESKNKFETTRNQNDTAFKHQANKTPENDYAKRGLFEGYLDPNIKNVHDPIPDFKGLVNKTAGEHYDLAIDSMLSLFFPVYKMTKDEQNFLFITNNLVAYIFKSCSGLEKYYSKQKRQNVIKVLSLIINEKCLDLLKIKFKIESNDQIISYILKSNDYKMFFLYLIVLTEIIEFFFFNIFQSSDSNNNNILDNCNNHSIKSTDKNVTITHPIQEIKFAHEKNYQENIILCNSSLNQKNEFKRNLDQINFEDINIEKVYEFSQDFVDKPMSIKKQLKLSPRKIHNNTEYFE